MKLGIAALMIAAPALGVGGSVGGQAGDAFGRSAIVPLPGRVAGGADKAALGRALFHDARLSRSGRLSCASCHDLTTNGASAKAVDRGDDGRATVFNTPTIFNSARNFRLGWRGRTRDMAPFIKHVLRSPHLMGGGQTPMRRLRSDADMVRAFGRIYDRAPDADAAADALAAFVRTLTTPDAPVDRWLAGDSDALSAHARRGYRKFIGLGCASCHQGANVGGNLFQRRGVFAPLGEAEPRYLRVPSLRNVAVTSPYFHDGRTTRLDEAIRQMARAQLNIDVDDRDVNDLVAFLEALTGTYEGRATRPAGKRPG